MRDVYIGKGKLAGKGVYAARDFKVGEMVMKYDLITLAQADFDSLPRSERMFVHSFWGKMYLFPKPSRYTNHSSNPNTRSDLKKMCDFAIRDINKDEMITTNATVEIQNELETFIEAFEKTKISNFKRLKGGYRNAVCAYQVGKAKKELTLKRIEGNWRVL